MSSTEDLGLLPVDLMMPGDLMCDTNGGLIAGIVKTELDPNAATWTITTQGGLELHVPVGNGHYIQRPEA